MMTSRKVYQKRADKLSRYAARGTPPLANIYEKPTILITRRTPFAQFNFALGKSKDKEIKRLHYAIEQSWPSPVELVDFPFFSLPKK